MVWWGIAAAAIVVALGSGWADHRRAHRRDLDQIGLIDWRTTQLVALASAMIATSIALNW
jgi:hypothetical protein